MFNIGGAELLVILLVALLVLGPDKLPQAARQVGHFVGEFQRVAGGFRQEIQSALEVEDDNAGRAGKSDSAGRPSTPRSSAPASEGTTADLVDDATAEQVAP